VKKTNVGGQAVIEGVMMMSPERVSIAVRNPEGKIIVDVHKRNERLRKSRIVKWFLARGIVSLIEMLYEGINAINYSATVAYEDENVQKDKKKHEGFLMGMVSFLAVILAFFIFLYLPIFIAGKIGLDARPVIFNIFVGGIRLVFFILYILGISFIPDIKRLFKYHGAEHKSIFCWEDGKELTVENCSNYSTKHPRCGTSFIFIVFTVAIVFFTIIDILLFSVLGIPSPKLLRLAIHLSFLPFLIGISYEIIKFAGNHKNNPLLRVILGPGLAFQYVTTKEPEPEQLEVGFAALRAALNIEDPSASAKGE